MMAENRKLCLAALCVSLLACLCSSSLASENEKRIIKKILSDVDNKLVIPPSGQPLTVEVNMMINEFPQFNGLDMEFSLSHDLRITWKDPRLRFDTLPEYHNITMLHLQAEQMEKIWKPSLFYSNERGSSLSSPLTDSNSLMRIYPDGSVCLIRRLETTVSCFMTFHKFPFDHQTCTIRLSSYGYTKEYLNIRWKRFDPLQIHEELTALGFSLHALEAGPYGDNGIRGSSSGVLARFYFKRESSFYILQVMR